MSGVEPVGLKEPVLACHNCVCIGMEQLVSTGRQLSLVIRVATEPLHTKASECVALNLSARQYPWQLIFLRQKCVSLTPPYYHG